MCPRVNNLLAVAFAILLSSSLVSARPVHAPKVMIDKDFSTIFDDGQAVVMAAQLHSQDVINLFGLTAASGNEWRNQEVVECLKAVERLGIGKNVPVYVGSQYPLLQSPKLLTPCFAQRSFAQRKGAFGSHEYLESDSAICSR